MPTRKTNIRILQIITINKKPTTQIPNLKTPKRSIYTIDPQADNLIQKETINNQIATTKNHTIFEMHPIYSW